MRPKPPAPPTSPPEPQAAQSAQPSPESAEVPQRPAPIPPPSEPKQFRAIGLVRGRYVPSEEQLSQGDIVTADEPIQAVLLGRVMSLVKNHVNLEEEHVWVVYPRTGQQDGKLHLQIVGVWEPETLYQDDTEKDEAKTDEAKTNESLAPVPSSEVKDGYFSIRGEVVFYSDDDERIIVKIRQSPRKDSQQTKFFKLQLKGKLEGKILRHFWSFDVQRNGETLQVEFGESMGPMPPKKKHQKFSQHKRKAGGRPSRGRGKPMEGRQRTATPRPKKVRDSAPKSE